MHVHLRRYFHRGVRLARLARAIWLGFFASILMALICAAIVRFGGRRSFTNSGPTKSCWGGAADGGGEPDRVSVRRIRQLVYAGENENPDARPHLWTRTVGSTVTGQFVDSIVFMLVAFLGKESLATIFTLIWSGICSRWCMRWWRRR